MEMSRWKAINETAKITKIAKLQELPNFARPTTKIDGVKGRPWTNHLTFSILNVMDSNTWSLISITTLNKDGNFVFITFQMYAIMHHSTVTKSYLVK